MVKGPTFLSLTAWRQVQETWLQKRSPGQNLGEHRQVRRSGITSKGIAFLAFSLRMLSFSLEVNSQRMHGKEIYPRWITKCIFAVGLYGLQCYSDAGKLSCYGWSGWQIKGEMAHSFVILLRNSGNVILLNSFDPK